MQDLSSFTPVPLSGLFRFWFSRCNFLGFRFYSSDTSNFTKEVGFACGKEFRVELMIGLVCILMSYLCSPCTLTVGAGACRWSLLCSPCTLTVGAGACRWSLLCSPCTVTVCAGACRWRLRCTAACNLLAYSCARMVEKALAVCWLFACLVVVIKYNTILSACEF